MGRKRAQVDDDPPMESGRSVRARKPSERAKAAVTMVKANDDDKTQAPPKKRGRPFGSKSKNKGGQAAKPVRKSPRKRQVVSFNSDGVDKERQSSNYKKSAKGRYIEVDDEVYEEEPTVLDFSRAVEQEVTLEEDSEYRGPTDPYLEVDDDDEFNPAAPAQFFKPPDINTWNARVDRLLTSTPKPRRSAATTTDSEEESGSDDQVPDIEVTVNNGTSSEFVTIQSDDLWSDVQRSVGTALGVMHLDDARILGYQAPWIKKIGNKVQTITLADQKGLDRLRSDFSSYIVAEKAKKSKTRKDTSPSIAIINLTPLTEGTGRGAKMNGNSRKGTWTANIAEQARQNVESEMATLVGAIKRDLECVEHSGRVCYVKYGGIHVPYDNDHFLEHAELLMKRVPGVTSNEIPKQLNMENHDKKSRPAKAHNAPISKTSHVSGSSEKSDSAASEDDGHHHQHRHSHRGFDESAPSRQDKHRYQSSTGEMDRRRDHPPPPASYEYPRVEDWLKSCKGDAKRGFDMHVEDCTALIDVFVTNGYHRVDDVLQCMEPKELQGLAKGMEVNISIGFAVRVMFNVKEEVKRIKLNNGRL